MRGFFNYNLLIRNQKVGSIVDQVNLANVMTYFLVSSLQQAALMMIAEQRRI